MQAPISANTMTVLKYSSETSHVAHISSSDSRASSRYRSTTVTVYYRSIRLLSAGLERAMQPLAEKERRRTSSLVQAIERVDGLAAVPCDRGIDRHEHRAQTAGRKASLIAVDGHGNASGASASRREKTPPCYSHCGAERSGLHSGRVDIHPVALVFVGLAETRRVL